MTMSKLARKVLWMGLLPAIILLGCVSFLHLSENEYPSLHVQMRKPGPDLETLHPDLRARYLYLRKFLLETKANREAIIKEFSKGLDVDLSDPRFSNYKSPEALNLDGDYLVDGNRGWQDDRDGQLFFETKNFNSPYWRFEFWYEIPWGLSLKRKFGDQMNTPPPSTPDMTGVEIVKPR